MPDHRGRIEGAMLGLLVGDALGVPYEFHPAASIPPDDAIEFEPPVGFHRAHTGTPPGTWSDDGAQALALLDSLLECGRLDPEDLGRRLLSWFDRGDYAVGGVVFDVGITTRSALEALRSGVPAIEAGPVGDYDNGNGSLMRVLPLALWHDGPDALLVADARLQSRVTHGHPRAGLCCALYCLWARRLLEGASRSDPWADAASTLRTLLASEPEVLRELDEQIRPEAPPRGRGSGYVVDALHSARMASASGTYEQAVRAAIRLGDDTDTTACLTGGVVGLRDGVEAIPTRWRSSLRGRGEIADPLIARLVARRGRPGR